MAGLALSQLKLTVMKTRLTTLETATFGQLDKAKAAHNSGSASVGTTHLDQPQVL